MKISNPIWNCCPCQSKLCVTRDPTQGLAVVSHHSTKFPLTIKMGKAQQHKTEQVQRHKTQTRHTAVMSTCWGGQPFPLACYSADQGQAGDQIKVLVWGELGPGAREAAWGMCTPTPGEGQWGALLQDKVKKRSCARNRPRASRLLGSCGKM